jgi:two-component system OmpR family sensor kinase
MNLFQNALRHTPDATAIEASVTTRGGVAVLAVTDHGEGISREHIAHVFERFYRADPSRTRGSGGAGLGLSIVASITEAHHGTVRVESVPGAGATFVVELPLLAAAEPVPDIAADRLAVTTPAGAVTPG